MSQADLVELVHSLQTQLAQRGAGAFRTLEIAFDLNDKDRNGTFDFQEVEAILAKAGLFLKVSDWGTGTQEREGGRKGRRAGRTAARQTAETTVSLWSTVAAPNVQLEFDPRRSHVSSVCVLSPSVNI